MKKKPRPPRTKATGSNAIPPQLAGLLALMSESGVAHSSEVTRALDASRAALRNALDTDVEERVSDYIGTEAARGPWKALHAFIETIDESDSHPFNAGDYHNIYSVPALTIGMALAYVYLMEGGAR